MNFDNAAFKHRMPQQKTAPGYEKLPMKRGIFFDMFPFSVIFRRDMTMYRIGDGLKEVFSDLQGKKVNEEFTLVRPMLEFSWDNVSGAGCNVCFSWVDTFYSIMQNVPKEHLVIYEVSEYIQIGEAREWQITSLVPSKHSKQSALWRQDIRLECQCRMWYDWDKVLNFWDPTKH